MMQHNRQHDLIALSLGGGRQSSYVYTAGVDGELPYKIDCAIFADTQYEPAGVYRMLNDLEKYGGDKVPIYRVTAGDIRGETLEGIEKNKRFASMPFFTSPKGMIRRQCTDHYKIRPVRKKIREILGVKSGVGKKVKLALGISLDEFERIKPSDVKYIEHDFPLIDMKMTSADCSRKLSEKGLTPVKSACICCPFRGEVSWVKMMREDPESFEEACKFDAKIRHHPKLREEQFLHRRRMPLRKAVLLDEKHIEEIKKEYGGDYYQEECSGFCAI